MNIGNLLSDRRHRVAVLLVIAVGWVVAVAGALFENAVVLGAGLVVAAGVSTAHAKLVLELVASLRQLNQATALLEAANATSIESTFRRLTADREESFAAFRAEQAVVLTKLDSLERRLAPSRRFAATQPVAELTHRELALSATLGGASIERNETTR